MNEHHDWALAGMRQDMQGITRDGHFVNQPLIHGVCVKQIVYRVNLRRTAFSEPRHIYA